VDAVDLDLQERLDAAYDDQGVDRSLIRANLALTPTERVAQLERFLEDLALVRRVSVPK
jgi:hypothetical protein